jgi:hypothetical protein
VAFEQVCFCYCFSGKLSIEKIKKVKVKVKVRGRGIGRGGRKDELYPIFFLAGGARTIRVAVARREKGEKRKARIKNKTGQRLENWRETFFQAVPGALLSYRGRRHRLEISGPVPRQRTAKDPPRFRPGSTIRRYSRGGPDPRRKPPGAPAGF